MATKIQRALLALHDNRGAAQLADQLSSVRIEVWATARTAAVLRQAKQEVIEVASFTGMPAFEHAGVMGRLETMHPRIHAALLFRQIPPDQPAWRAEAHAEALRYAEGRTIDLVFTDFPPLPTEGTLEEFLDGVDLDTSALVRAAAVCFERVTVVSSREEWPAALKPILARSETSLELRQRLAQRALAQAARYDDVVASLASTFEPDGSRRKLPTAVALHADALGSLPAANPQQVASFYKVQHPPQGTLPNLALVGEGNAVPTLLDMLDANVGLEVVAELTGPAAALVVRRKPVAASSATDLAGAWSAISAACDGSFARGVVVVNQQVDDETAKALEGTKLAAIVAPSFSTGALDALMPRKDLPLMAVQSLLDPTYPSQEWLQVPSGLFVQTRDATAAGEVERGRCTTERKPPEHEIPILAFAWKVAKYARSDAAVIARRDRDGGFHTVGTGAGAASPREALEIALARAGTAARWSVVAFDGALVSADAILLAAQAGIVSIVHAGDERHEAMLVSAANTAGIALTSTGVSHLRA